jgi:hypothetical protein
MDESCAADRDDNMPNAKKTAQTGCNTILARKVFTKRRLTDEQQESEGVRR